MNYLSAIIYTSIILDFNELVNGSSLSLPAHGRAGARATIKYNSQPAEKYAQQENPERIRDFLKKIGSNFRIADRTLFLDFKNTFKIAEKYHDEALCAEATSYDFAKSENWRCFLDDVRTFFEQNPE